MVLYKYLKPILCIHSCTPILLISASFLTIGVGGKQINSCVLFKVLSLSLSTPVSLYFIGELLFVIPISDTFRGILLFAINRKYNNLYNVKNCYKRQFAYRMYTRELLPMKEANIPSEPHDIHDIISFFCLFIVPIIIYLHVISV